MGRGAGGGIEGSMLVKLFLRSKEEHRGKRGEVKEIDDRLLGGNVWIP